MRAWRAVKPLVSSSLQSSSSRTRLSPTLFLLHFFSAQPRQSIPPPSSAPAEEYEDSESVFDSSDFSFPVTLDTAKPEPTWNEAYRAKVDRTLFGVDTTQQQRQQVEKESEKKKKKKERWKEKKSLLPPEEDVEDEKWRANRLAKVLLQAALEKPDDVEEEESGMLVEEEDQRSLSVGIIGAPNAGKSCLTNFMVGTKVAAVSRKTNTTIHEVLGVMTKGNTQICFFDTPGLMLKRGQPYRADVKVRNESAWSSVNLYDVLIVIFDVHRHLNQHDSRVTRLIKHLGADEQPKQKRILCMNKVDLVEVKKDLLKVAEEFGDLPGYERYFMISGLKGSGVKDLIEYLMEQALAMGGYGGAFDDENGLYSAVKRPWDEDPAILNEDVMKNISLEVVREKMLDHIHQEIPYTIEHRLMDWKELRDGSLRVEQHFITSKLSQRKILVGKNGSKIGRIGLEANQELRSIFKRDVHLILQVRVA